MKRVLLLIKGLGPGGAERLLVNAAPFVDRTRFQYEVAYLLAGDDQLRPELEAAGLPVHCLAGARPRAWPQRLRHIAAGFDLVHVHSPYLAAAARLVLPRSLPLVYTEHDVWASYHPATAAANALTYPRNDHVFAVSEEVRRSVRYPRPLRGLLPAVETLYQGAARPPADAEVDAGELRRELGLAADAPVVGTVANYRPEKGHEHLLAAAGSVRKALPDARFVLVGGGPLEKRVRREAADLGLNGTVVFAEPRTDGARVAAAFDVFVLASLHEGLPIALLEAMAHGRPVVVTDAGGIPEAVRHREEGIVVPAGEPAALADGILEVLGDPALGRRMGDAGRRRAAAFDIRRTVLRTESVYAELLR